jgi:hypothetical protein
MSILWALEALLYCTAGPSTNHDKLHAPLDSTDKNGPERPQDHVYRLTDDSTLVAGGTARISEQRVMTVSPLPPPDNSRSGNEDVARQGTCHRVRPRLRAIAYTLR